MNFLKRKTQRKCLGFSLMQTSIALTVSALVMSAILPGSGSNDDAAKVALTKQRMVAIEEATKKFMATNYRRPCPANGTLAPTNASFGNENGTAGSCATATFGPQTSVLTGLASSYVVAGTVPVRALGLPDEYALDGFGRRFTYIVDRLSTSSTNCRTMQSVGTKGMIQIKNASTDTVVKDLVMAAIISHGKDGHGAFPPNGSTVANRINTYSSDTNSQTNAFVNSSFTYSNASYATSTIKGNIIQREASSTFDDIVYYDESTKDKCCIGLRCSQGFRVDANAGGVLDATGGINYAIGDFNGDGYKDIAISNYNNSDGNVVSLLMTNGSGGGWPVGTAGITLASYTTLFIVKDVDIPYLGYSIAAGDVTGDGLDDLLIVGEGKAILLYELSGGGGEGMIQLRTITDSKDYTVGIDITHSGANQPGAAAIDDIDDDGYEDVIFSTEETPSATGINAGSEVAVVWGRESVDFTATIDFTTSSDGFYIYSNSALGWPLAFSAYLHSIATGNFDGDTYQDIVIGAPTLIGATGSISSVFGRKRASWTTALVSGVYARAFETDAFSGSDGFTLLDDTGGSNFGQSVAVADMNKDGYDDALSVSNGYIVGLYGKSGSYTIPWDTVVASFFGGTAFAVDITTNRPAEATVGNNTNILNAADINADGRPDILLSNRSAYMNNTANAGMTYVMFNPTTSLGYPSNGFVAQYMFTATNNGYGTFDGTKGFVIEGAASDYASNVGVMDFNGDRKMDILVASPGYNSNTSALYIVYGRTNTDWKTRTTTLSATPAEWPKIDLTDFNQ